MQYFKLKEVLANDNGASQDSSVGRVARDSWLQQEACEAAALVNSAEYKALGHWYYDGSRNFFMLDQTAASFIGIENYHEPVGIHQIVRLLSSFDATRMYLNLNDSIMGDLIYEHLTLNGGPYSGKDFVIQGSVLHRNPDGSALYAVGYISHEFSPHSELLPREISGDGMYIWDSATNELVCSASYHAMIGYKEEDFPRYIDDFITRIVHPDDNDFFMVLSHMCQSEQYGDYFESCMRIRHKDGHYIWTVCRGLVQERDVYGRARRVIGTQTNINLVQSSFDNIKLMMFTDSLTGLHNRNYLMQNYTSYEQKTALPVSVMYIDISGLKLTNDILGHSYGDYLLIKARDLIKEGITTSSYKNVIAKQKATASEHKDPRQTYNAGHTSSSSSSNLLDLIDDGNIDLERFNAGTYKLGSDYQSKASSNTSSSSFLEQNKDINLSGIGANEDHGVPYEIMRLSGDEFVVLLPHCDEKTVSEIALNINRLREEHNNHHKLNSTIEQRPVPIFFGIGCTTFHGSSDSSVGITQAIHEADELMQKDKDSRRDEFYAQLKDFFEAKKGRRVSMRDDRRINILTEAERDQIRSNPN